MSQFGDSPSSNSPDLDTVDVENKIGDAHFIEEPKTEEASRDDDQIISSDSVKENERKMQPSHAILPSGVYSILGSNPKTCSTDGKIADVKDEILKTVSLQAYNANAMLPSSKERVEIMSADAEAGVNDQMMSTVAIESREDKIASEGGNAILPPDFMAGEGEKMEPSDSKVSAESEASGKGLSNINDISSKLIEGNDYKISASDLIASVPAGGKDCITDLNTGTTEEMTSRIEMLGGSKDQHAGNSAKSKKSPKKRRKTNMGVEETTPTESLVTKKKKAIGAGSKPAPKVPQRQSPRIKAKATPKISPKKRRKINTDDDEKISNERDEVAINAKEQLNNDMLPTGDNNEIIPSGFETSKNGSETRVKEEAANSPTESPETVENIAKRDGESDNNA